uniref:Uncharacterized protein n=1 Tax=Cacopsylla melanoneura TaxID=428564 RepID=A0A8D8YKN4_9HEMI
MALYNSSCVTSPLAYVSKVLSDRLLNFFGLKRKEYLSKILRISAAISRRIDSYVEPLNLLKLNTTQGIVPWTSHRYVSLTNSGFNVASLLLTTILPPANSFLLTF